MGIVIQDNNEKVNILISDTNVYEKFNVYEIISESSENTTNESES